MIEEIQVYLKGAEMAHGFDCVHGEIESYVDDKCFAVKQGNSKWCYPLNNIAYFIINESEDDEV